MKTIVENWMKKDTIATIEKDFTKACTYFGEKREEIETKIEALDEMTAICMKYLYAYMPLSDVGAYEFKTFLSYANHAVCLIKERRYEIPQEYFFNYVVSHRINSEDITKCREFFYEQLVSRIQGLSMEDAVLEINNWCYEQATYRCASPRTASPITVYKGGFGRCGEESTFLTTALRSVGIPARQIYAPRWSHSDDNHAWTEVWCNGTWYYTGACEPKPIFNNGWFPYAASRSMLLHSRLFSNIGLRQEEIAGYDGIVVEMNNSDMYAHTKWLTLHVRDEHNNPIPNAVVRFEIVNSAEFFPLVHVRTDERGALRVKLGLGDIYVSVVHNKKTVRQFVEVQKVSEVTLFVKEEEKADERWKSFRLVAPESAIVRSKDMTAEQEEAQNERNRCAEDIRRTRIEGYYDAEYVEKLKEYPNIQEVLSNAKGNFEEIRRFLDVEVAGITLTQKDILLGEISFKDCRDISCEVLVDQLDAFAYEKELVTETFTKEMFQKYVLSPRIYFEMVTTFRSFIKGFFGEDRRDFKEHPKLIWEYIKENVTYYEEKEYTTIYATPKSALTLKAATPMSARILFVAICRTYGIPARLDEFFLDAQYYQDGEFVSVEKEYKKDAKVSLVSKEESDPVYYRHFTIGRKEADGQYQTLEAWGAKFEGKRMEFEVAPGEYRIVTSDRMSSGSVLGKMYTFEIAAKEEKEIVLEFSDLKAEDLMKVSQLPSFLLKQTNGCTISSDELTATGKNIFIWADAGKEPTEHVFNELIEIQQNGGFPTCHIHVIIKDDLAFEDHTFVKLKETFPTVSILYDDFGKNLEVLSKVTKVDTKTLPYVLVTDSCNHGIYACSSYNVGTGDVLAKLVRF